METQPETELSDLDLEQVQAGMAKVVLTKFITEVSWK